METGTTGQDNRTFHDFSGYGRDAAPWEGRVGTGHQVEATLGGEGRGELRLVEAVESEKCNEFENYVGDRAF